MQGVDRGEGEVGRGEGRGRGRGGGEGRRRGVHVSTVNDTLSDT